MASWAPDTKPEPRKRASGARWQKIRRHFEFASCVHCGLRHQSLHHIVPRSQGGDDVEENLAPMCGDGTRGCHGMFEGKAPGWERVARSIRNYVYADPNRVLYAIRKLGEDRFNRRYPGAEKCDRNPNCLVIRGHGGPCITSLSDPAFWTGTVFKN